MDVKSFLISFENRLISNGLTRESARHHTLKIAKSLTEQDKVRIHAITDNTAIEKLADSYTEKVSSLPDHGAEGSKPNTQTISRQFNESVKSSHFNTASTETRKTQSNTAQTAVATKEKQDKAEQEDTAEQRKPTQNISAVGKNKKIKKVKLTPRGKAYGRSLVKRRFILLVYRINVRVRAYSAAYNRARRRARCSDRYRMHRNARRSYLRYHKTLFGRTGRNI